MSKFENFLKHHFSQVKFHNFGIFGINSASTLILIGPEPFRCIPKNCKTTFKAIEKAAQIGGYLYKDFNLGACRSNNISQLIGPKSGIFSNLSQHHVLELRYDFMGFLGGVFVAF